MVLTSVLYNLQGAGYDLVRRLVKGQLPNHFYRSYNLKNAHVGELAPFYNLSSQVPASVKKTLASIRAKVIAGTIKVPDETQGSPTIGTVGSGAKINVASLGCKPVK